MEITVNQIRLFYTQAGIGAPLILLHGNGEDHTLFTDLQTKLASDYTVYAIDSRDHGQSQHDVPLSYQLMADDIMNFTDALQLKNITLVGFSDGAITSMLIASQRPALVHKVVLAGGNLTPQGIKAPIRFGVRATNWRKHDPLLSLMLNEPHISTKTLHQITAQAFVIAGEKDVVKKSETVEIASAIPTSILRIVPGASHSDYVKDNTTFYHYIAAFLQPYRTE